MNTEPTLKGSWQADLTDFYLDGLRIPSLSAQEGVYARRIREEMIRLGYDEVWFDRIGNVCGRLGNGPLVIHLDSHMDTVEVHDPQEWRYPPFAGTLADGVVHGRGSVDMKGGLSASIYGAALARDRGDLAGKTVYVTATVDEEYCDGVCLQHFYQDSGIRPDCVVICEPSECRVVVGHSGKLQTRLTTHGVSAHGSTPQLGVNAVYAMAPIIAGVEALNETLAATPGGGTVVLSHIDCVTASLNAVPSECGIYLDRRLRLGETIAQVEAELDGLVVGRDADWKVGILRHTSWTGEELVYEPRHDPWQIPSDHPLTQAAHRAWRDVYNTDPGPDRVWDFGTNAVVPVAMGIPVIGFGPGDPKLAHQRDECCPLDQVLTAADYYAQLIREIRL